MENLESASKVTGPRWWWFSFLVAVSGSFFARRIYVSNLSFWSREPDTTASAIAILVASVSLVAFAWMSARRATEIGSAPKFLLTCLILLPIPFWIVALGFLPNKDDRFPTPIQTFLRRIKLTAVGATAVGILVLAGYLAFGTNLTSALATKSGRAIEIQSSGSNAPTYEACYENGIKYYEEIGSYSRLRSTGEYVPDVVAGMCSRSRIAFGY